MKRVLLSLFCLASLSLLQAQTSSDQIHPEDLIAYWPFDGSAVDLSGNGHDPAVVQNVSFVPDRLGQPYGALAFNGTNSLVEVPHAAGFNSLPITISAWYRPDNVNSPGMGSQIIGKYINSSWNGWFIRLNTENEMIVPGYLVGIPSAGCDAVIEGYGCGNGLNEPGTAPLSNNWRHMAFVVDEVEGRLYIDGVLVSSQTWAGTPSQVTASTTVRIGMTHTNSEVFSGDLDDVALWSRALTGPEIMSLASYENLGCTDESACNYDPGATELEPESCVYPLVENDCYGGSVACGPNTVWNPILQMCIVGVPESCGCAGDIDMDGIIGVNDLLGLLASFGTECPLSGCTWPEANNYSPSAEVDDGSCLFDQCDDPSVPGSPCSDGMINTIGDTWNESGCVCEGTAAVNADGSGPCEGQSTLVYDGETYNLVEIGDQCWFREDLSTSTFTNGDPIPVVTDYGVWSSTGLPAMSLGGGDSEEYQQYGGAYYNAHAVLSPLGLCPSGWNVASDEEWMSVEAEAGMSLSELYSDSMRGTGVSVQLKANSQDSIPWNGDNSLGLSIAPGGQRVYNGFYANRGGFAHIWTSSISDVNTLWVREFNGNNNGIIRTKWYVQNNGFSVRCVKSAENTCWDPEANGLCAEDEITGCTDETSCTFDPNATQDDGSCTYPSSSCCDCDGNDYSDGDGLCPCAGEDIPGCIDPSACNYNPDANDEDGSCVYTSGFDACGCELDCEGNLINDLDGDGLCDEVASEGCMDASACNYDPDYQCEGGDSNCIYGSEEPGSSCDDGDDNTFNDVWDDTGCECTGQPAVDPAGEGPCAGENSLTYNGQDYGLLEVGDHCWFRENLRTTQFANGESIPLVEVDSVWANTDGAARSPFNGELGNSETFGELYNWHAVSDDRGLCPAGWRVPGDTMWMNLEAALGMDSAAVLETGLRGTGVGEQLKASEPAWNGTDVSGFTALPGGFRTNLGSFLNQTILGYWWSTKPDSPHHAWYRGLSSMNDGVQRNIFNRQAGLSVRCVKGEQPVLCNNEPGAACDDGDANTFNDVWDDSGCACAGTDAVLLDGSGPCEGQASVDYFDQTYLLVEIGDQCWFRENLATEHYANGDAIPGNLSNAEWTSTSSGAQTVYDEDLANLDTYGRLYNWYAVDDTRGLCPSGWHVPTEGEWVTLEMQLGMTSSDANTSGLRGTDQGAQMKSSSSDIPSWDGINISGFSALPGGLCSDLGGFGNGGNYGYWWSGSPVGPSYSWFRSLLSNSGAVYRDNGSQRSGFSVRCVKGEQPVLCNNEAGAACDDGDDNTFNDVWDESGCACAGTPFVAVDGSGPCEGEQTVLYHD